jgi:3-oxoacyl-[acyl-carrier-protein] synthase-1
VNTALDILSCGAVTSVGLDAFQTAAAFRARIAGFEEAISLPPPQEPLRGARVPSRTSMRRTPTDWLVNLGARAVREALGYRSVNGRLGLILTPPEETRRHPALDGVSMSELLRAIAALAGQRFERTTIAAEGGAGIANGLQVAAGLMSRGDLDACVVGGVDSLLNERDIASLRNSGRMLEPGNPGGLIPGEGAGFVVVGLPGRNPSVLARVLGVGAEIERDHVLGTRLSQGHAFAAALKAAADTVTESQVSFRVSTVNGEHYAVWESMFFTSRFYRTRRERLPVWYSASSVGEIGAASGAVGVVLAAFGIAGGYAPGPCAMCEASSDTGLRSAVLVGPAVDAPIPPFHPEHGASLHVLQSIHR